MDKLILGIVGVILSAFTMLVVICTSSIIGAVIGWCVGWLFDATSLKVLTEMGLTHFKMWEIGATLGFVGGFFRSTS